MKNLNIDLDKIKSFSFKSLSLPVNLQQRDKMALTVAAVVVGVLLILQWTVFPILDRRTRLRDDIKTSKAALAKMQLIKAEHGTLARNNQDLDGALRRRPKNFTLFSFIDQLAGKNNIKQNITTNHSVGSLVALTLQLGCDILSMLQVIEAVVMTA